MVRINSELLKDIIFSRNSKNLQKTIQKSAKKYHLNESQLLKLTPDLVYDLALILNQKRTKFNQHTKINAPKEAYWLREELKIFIWTVIFYCHTLSIDINEMNQKQLNVIQKIFGCKQKMFLRYQLYYIFNTNFEARPNWIQQQNRLLIQINRDFQDNTNWKSQSFQLFIRSNGIFYKTPEACRDRWENHLNPKIQKGKWTSEEDLRMLQLIQDNGMKWAMISKKMNEERTQHMIKNRFNSLMKKMHVNNKKISHDRVIGKMLKTITNKIHAKEREQITSVEEKQSVDQDYNIKEEIYKQEKMLNQGRTSQEQTTLMMEEICFSPQIFASIKVQSPAGYKSMDEILEYDSPLSLENNTFLICLQSFDQEWIEPTQQIHSIFDSLLF